MEIIYSHYEECGGASIIGLYKSPLTSTTYNTYWRWLEDMTDFKGGTTEFGNIPREQKFYDINMRYFSKKWKNQNMPRWMSHKYDSMLLQLQDNIQQLIAPLPIFHYPGVKKPTLNSCLINKYSDGSCSIKAHRDSCDTFGPNPTVIGLSLGDERTIVFKRILYDPNNLKSIKINTNNPEEIRVPLPSGSIMIMAGCIQKYFSHEIPKCKNKKKRYSLTFREYL